MVHSTAGIGDCTLERFVTGLRKFESQWMSVASHGVGRSSGRHPEGAST